MRLIKAGSMMNKISIILTTVVLLLQLSAQATYAQRADVQEFIK